MIIEYEELNVLNDLIVTQVGVLFNDSTKLVLDAAGNQLSYMDKENLEEYYTMSHFPESLNKKVFNLLSWWNLSKAWIIWRLKQYIKIHI